MGIMSFKVLQGPLTGVHSTSVPHSAADEFRSDERPTKPSDPSDSG